MSILVTDGQESYRWYPYIGVTRPRGRRDVRLQRQDLWPPVSFPGRQPSALCVAICRWSHCYSTDVRSRWYTTGRTAHPSATIRRRPLPGQNPRRSRSKLYIEPKLSLYRYIQIPFDDQLWWIKHHHLFLYILELYQLDLEAPYLSTNYVQTLLIYLMIYFFIYNVLR